MSVLHEDKLGLRHGAELSQEEKLIHNGWVSDVYGRTLAFSDIGIAEVALIEENAGTYGALLLYTEHFWLDLDSEAHPMEGSNEDVTEEQNEALEMLAGLDLDGEPESASLLKDAQEALPNLFLANIAIEEGCILFRDGWKSRVYPEIVRHWSQVVRQSEDLELARTKAVVQDELISIGHDPSVLSLFEELDDQAREAMRNLKNPGTARLFAKAQILQQVSLPLPRFVTHVAQKVIAASDE